VATVEAVNGGKGVKGNTPLGGAILTTEDGMAELAILVDAATDLDFIDFLHFVSPLLIKKTTSHFFWQYNPFFPFFSLFFTFFHFSLFNTLLCLYSGKNSTKEGKSWQMAT